MTQFLSVHSNLNLFKLSNESWLWEGRSLGRGHMFPKYFWPHIYNIQPHIYIYLAQCVCVFVYIYIYIYIYIRNVIVVYVWDILPQFFSCFVWYIPVQADISSLYFSLFKNGNFWKFEVFYGGFSEKQNVIWELHTIFSLIALCLS